MFMALSTSGKWVFPTGVISILIGFSLFLHACDNMEATKEREIMAVTKTNSMPNHWDANHRPFRAA